MEVNPAKRKLTDVQLEEVRRCFAMCDRDGSGTITQNELKTVLRAVLQEEPDDETTTRLFMLMDKNGDGTVELNEFIEVMADWMGGDEWEKRRKSANTSIAEERLGVHQQIKAFFSQFNEADTFSAARQKLKERVFRQTLTMDQMEDEDDFIMSGTKRDSDDQAKLNALNFANECVLNFGSVVANLNSNNPYLQVEAIKNINQLLSLVVLFNTPLERRSIATVLAKVFQLLYGDGVMNRVIYLLNTPQPPVQLQALIALTLYIPGPRIASTPINHELHPDKMLFKRHVKNANCIPVVYGLLEHSLEDIREQAVACLGAFAAQHPAARDYLLQNNGLKPLLRFAQPNQSISMLRKLSFVLACMVGYTHPIGFAPEWNLVRPALPAIANLAYSNDDQILRNVMAALQLILPVVPEPNMLSRLLDILAWVEDSQAESVLAALRVVQEVIKMDHTQTKMLLEQMLLGRIRNLLKHRNDHVRLEAVETLIILSQKGQAQALFEGKIIPIVLELLASDSFVRLKVAKLFRLVTNGTPQQVSYMVLSCDVIKKLADGLVHFKEYDTVLSKIYKFMGPSYNFSFVNDLVTALHNITNVGFMVSEQTGENNAYALRFTMGDLDQIKNLLNLIASNAEEERAWRKTAEQDEQFSARQVEELIASLLFKIKKANDRATSSQARVMSQEIQAIWDRFFGKSASAQTSSDANIYFKCIMQGTASGDDIRIVEASRTIDFVKLRDLLQVKYHRKLTLRFKDSDGDLVVLDSDAALRRALQAARNNTVVVHLQDLGDLMSAAASNPLANSSTNALELSPTSSPMPGKKKRQFGEEGSEKNLNQYQQQGQQQQAQQQRQQQQQQQQQQATFSSSPPPAQTPLSPAHGQGAAGQTSSSNNSNNVNTSGSNWVAGLEQTQIADRTRHLEQLRDKIGLTTEQVGKLQGIFSKLCDGEGFLNRYKFAEGLRTIGMTNDLLIEQNWNAFDMNRDGKISMSEFITAVGIMAKGSLQEKLRFIFNMYDRDSNGTLDKEEVLEIFKVSAGLKGFYHTPAQLRKMVDDTFREIDLNGDGKLDFKEFELAIQRNQLEVNTRIAFV